VYDLGAEKYHANHGKGGATCLIVEDPPEKAQKAQDPRRYHVVTVSARTAYSLRENKQRLVQFLGSHPNVKLSDLAYTTTARRLHHAMRSAYSAQTIRDLTRLISADFAEAVEVKIKRASAQSSVVFAFTGQGSLYPGMGKQLFQTCLRFRESILSYQKICDSQGLPSVVDLIADDHADLKSKTIVQIQLATVFLEIALADLWKSWGVKPSLLIGHSLGEYAAVCVAGVMSISDTLHLVGRRSLIMLERCAPGSHAMLAVESSWQTTENVLATRDFPSCQISCMNAPNTTIISGTIRDLKNLQSLLQASRTRSTFLQVSYGFHSPQVDPILADFERSATGVHFAKPLIPIASTLTGMIVDDAGTFTPTYLVRHAREPVNFVGALQTCRLKGFADEHTLWMEMGPESVCLGLIRSSLEVPSTRLLPSIMSSRENWETISSSIATAYTWNVAVDWTEYQKEYTNSLTLLEIPTYAFDLKDYWSSYKQELLLPQTSQATSVSATAPSRISLTTTCLQYVEKESFQGNDMSVTFSSHTSEPKLFDAIQNHLVDNTALCPASVFCEMAFTAAKYIYTKAKPGKSVPAMSLWALEITHPLVVPVSNPEQVVDVTAKKSGVADWLVNVSFTSRDGSSFDEHGGCQVRFDQTNDLKNQFSRTLHLVKKRKVVLISSAAAGLSHRLLKPIVYKLFSTVIDYGDKYQGLEEVFLDSGYTDAAARVKLGPSTGTGNFTYNPYWTDAIVHLAGFILNGNVTKPNDVAYISAGFETLHFFEELSEDKSYTSYVCMQAMEKKGVFVGDVYVFEDEQLVCLCAGVFFQEMTKRVLNAIFRKGSESAVQGITSRSRVANTKRTSGEHINEMHRKEQTSSSETSHTSESAPGLSTSSSQTSLDGQEDLDVADTLLAIVALECGVDIKDMEPSTMFSDMGVDSLMSIAIISAVKERMDLDLPATFFNDQLTVADVRGEFGKQPQANETSRPTVTIPEVKVIDGASIPSEELSPTSTKSDSEKSEENGMTPPTPPADPIPAIVPQPSIESPKKTASQRASNVVLIRGRASSKETPLFLMTDEAGSATAYIHLPPISTGNRIYALESPFLRCPVFHFQLRLTDIIEDSD
jgi:iterative type I PKS product template protein